MLENEIFKGNKGKSREATKLYLIGSIYMFRTTRSKWEETLVPRGERNRVEVKYLYYFNDFCHFKSDIDNGGSKKKLE